MTAILFTPRIFLSGTLLFALVSGALWVRAQQADTRPLASLLPPGALLYLEAKDFHGLLNQWNSSTEKKNWLASDNFGVLSRSRLIQRLAESQTQFESVAGVPIELSLLNQAAGGRTAFAFYDLPNLTFVYLTKLESSRLGSNDLWRNRSKYRQRQIAGIPFYVNANAASHSTVAIAAYNDWLVIATGENLIAQTLVLLSGAKAASLGTESWFTDTTGQAKSAGDLRLVYNLDKLLPTPQFRTYWLQRNASELKPFTAGLADLFERNNGFEEQRVMLRRSPEPIPAPAPALNEVWRYAPKASSLNRAWSAPNRDTVAAVLQQVLLAEVSEAPQSEISAPQVSAEGASVGSSADFETRIDQPPFRRTQAESISGLIDSVMKMQPTALLHTQSTAVLNDRVFVLPQSGAAIQCEHADRDALERSMAGATSILQTGSLDPLHVTVSGNMIVITRTEIARAANPPQVPDGTTYLAAFNKEVEWPHYKQLFSLVDRTPVNPIALPSQNTPTFFSGNLRSLGGTLGRLNHASIESQDNGAQLRETVRYQLRTP
ncbi:MAG: hypothetical protein M3Y24_05600 [Acidobacteriota bacterium]|nr:hypothetical protein [Acidobacteriota bacterium]